MIKFEFHFMLQNLLVPAYSTRAIKSTTDDFNLKVFVWEMAFLQPYFFTRR